MKIISFIERGQRDIVEKVLRHCGLWEGPLRTLATARAPPGRKTPDRESAEPRELQLVLDPEFLYRPSAPDFDMPGRIRGSRTRRSDRGSTPNTPENHKTAYSRRAELRKGVPRSPSHQIVALGQTPHQNHTPILEERGKILDEGGTIE